ncbi:solute carrier family 41 [Pancytospora epiphaga]|nr:solute carrier family 41 [Pancytospora epiphaga]
MKTRYYFDKCLNTTLILQSTPSLIISLFGTIFTGMLFESSIRQPLFKNYPIILISGCILSFKGNIELNFAMYLSSLRSQRITNQKYYSTAIKNFGINFLESFAVGLSAGCIGSISSLMKSSPVILSRMIAIPAATLLVCCVSSLLFFTMLMSIIEIVHFTGMNVENVILPILNAFNDFTIVRSTIFFLEVVDRFYIEQCIIIEVALFCLVLVLCMLGVKIQSTTHRCDIYILVISYLVTIISGSVLEHYSSTFLHIATVFPVTAGMCGSIAFIHMHQKIHPRVSSRVSWYDSQQITLILMSFMMSVFYVIIAALLGYGYTPSYSILFVFMFICQVGIMLFISEVVFKYFKIANGNLPLATLPIVSCISDFLSVILLVTLAFISKKTK